MSDKRKVTTDALETLGNIIESRGRDAIHLAAEPVVAGMEDKYPIGGYAPGGYMCSCSRCKAVFHGDKRAFQCEKCAMADQETHEWIIEILDWVADNYKITSLECRCEEIITGGQPLWDAYNKERINKILEQIKSLAKLPTDEEINDTHKLARYTNSST